MNEMPKLTDRQQQMKASARGLAHARRRRHLRLALVVGGAVVLAVAVLGALLAAG